MRSCNCTLPPSCCVNCSNNREYPHENSNTYIPNPFPVAPTITWPSCLQPFVSPQVPTGKRVIEEFDSEGKIVKRTTEDIVAPELNPWYPSYPIATYTTSTVTSDNSK